MARTDQVALSLSKLDMPRLPAPLDSERRAPVVPRAAITAHHDEDALGLGYGEPTLLRTFGKLAASPGVSIYDTNLVRTLIITAPGADLRNTEACWDAATQRLWVGVWLGRRPVSLTLPLRFPVPEVAWLTSFYLPAHAGALAKVAVERGRITVQVQAHLAPNVIPLRHRDSAEMSSGGARTSATAADRSGERQAKAQPIAGSSLITSAMAVERETDRPPSGLHKLLRIVGITLGAILSVPVLMLSLFLFGFLLLPLLPFIGVTLLAATGGAPSAPPARPRLPAGAASAPSHTSAQAA